MKPSFVIAVALGAMSVIGEFYAKCFTTHQHVHKATKRELDNALSHAGAMGYDGTLRKGFILLESNELLDLGFVLSIQHSINMNAAGYVSSQWTIPALFSAITHGNAGELRCTIAGMQIGTFADVVVNQTGRQQIGNLSIEKLDPGVLELRDLKSERLWRFDHGLLNYLKDKSGNAYEVISIGARLQSIRRVAGTRDTILNIYYARCGLPSKITANGKGSVTLDWDSGGMLLGWQRNEENQFHFGYADGLLHTITLNGYNVDLIEWKVGERKSLINTPVHLLADIDYNYQYRTNQRGIEIVASRKDYKEVWRTLWNPLSGELTQRRDADQ